MHAVFGIFHGGSDRTQSFMVPTEVFRGEVLGGGLIYMHTYGLFGSQRPHQPSPRRKGLPNP